MKPTTVYITKGKHASQNYTVLIQPPKGEAYFVPNPKNGKPQRYARVYTAKRGALRNLDAVTHNWGHPGREWNFTGNYVWCKPKGVLIKFVIK